MKAELVLEALIAALNHPVFRRFIVLHIRDAIDRASEPQSMDPIPRQRSKAQMEATRKMVQRTRERRASGFHPDDDECQT